MRVAAERGVKSVEKFGWGAKTAEVLAMLKHKEARYYLVVTDVNGDEVSVEITDPRQITLRSGTEKRPNATNVKLPIVALEVEVPGEPPFPILENATGTMYVEANELKPRPKSSPSADFKTLMNPTYFVNETKVKPVPYRDTFPLNAFDAALAKPPRVNQRVDVYYDQQRGIYTHKTRWKLGSIDETCYIKQFTQEEVDNMPAEYLKSIMSLPDYGNGPDINRAGPPPV